MAPAYREVTVSGGLGELSPGPSPPSVWSGRRAAQPLSRRLSRRKSRS